MEIHMLQDTFDLRLERDVVFSNIFYSLLLPQRLLPWDAFLPNSFFHDRTIAVDRYFVSPKRKASPTAVSHKSPDLNWRYALYGIFCSKQAATNEASIVAKRTRG